MEIDIKLKDALYLLAEKIDYGHLAMQTDPVGFLEMVINRIEKMEKVVEAARKVTPKQDLSQWHKETSMYQMGKALNELEDNFDSRPIFGDDKEKMQKKETQSSREV